MGFISSLRANRRLGGDYMQRAFQQLGIQPQRYERNGNHGSNPHYVYKAADVDRAYALGQKLQAADEQAYHDAHTPAAAPAPPSDIMEREGDSGSSGDAQQRKKRRGGGKSSLLIPSASSTGLNL